MTPPDIETSTDARSKSRVELAPTMPCKKEEDQRSTREVPLAPELREERQAYVREKWECIAEIARICDINGLSPQM